MGKSYEQRLKELAKLAVTRGIALQKGEFVGISAPVSCSSFVEMLVEEAFCHGASDVHVHWEAPEVDRKRILYAPEESLRALPDWELAGMNRAAAENGCLIQVRSPLFETYGDEVLGRAEMFSAAQSMAGSIVTEKKMTFTCPWVVVLLPSVPWARKVYPELSDKEAYKKLAETLMDCARIKEKGTTDAWDEHCRILRERAVYLSEKKIRKLSYKNGLGTDFSICLVEPYRWSGGAVHLPSGRKIIPNLPTEEIATAPQSDSAQGTVAATKPFLFGNDVIEGMRLRFEKGVVIEYHADRGQETLERMFRIDTSDAGRRLGEVALVPESCQISQKNTLFYNTILDENASCHLALGNAYGKLRAGVNKGAPYHVDFMIGSPDLEIEAECDSGERFTVFHKGEWAF